jgi:polyphosphate kinase
MIGPAMVEQARLHVRRFFPKRMPAWLHYHDLEHTLGVAAAAKSIGSASGLKGRQLALVELAALFHDTGYAIDPKGHEAESAKLATHWLESHGADIRAVRTVAAMIMATRTDTRPRTLAQRILRDADSAHAGQVDFMEKSARLRKEREALTGKAVPPGAWQKENLEFLGKHQFHTAYAAQRYGRQKEINLRLLAEPLPKQPGHPDAKGKRHTAPFADRDLSWLAFNARVLQEAQDPQVPLLERLKFVAIHSRNLDEFYRVRVAQLRSLSKLGKWNRTALEVPPDKQIARINQAALKQQAALGKVSRNELMPALAKNGIRIRNEKQLTQAQRAFVRKYFQDSVVPLLWPMSMHQPKAIFIEDRKLYLIISLVRRSGGKARCVILNVPSDVLGRFVKLPPHRTGTDLMFLDDVVRLGAATFFKGCTVKSCYAVQLSRDAELHLDEEFAEDVAEKVRRSLGKRKTGVPARFLYDAAMPRKLLAEVRQALSVKRSDMLEAGRYHNLGDLDSLPVHGHADLRDAPMPPVAHPALRKGKMIKALASGDILLHFPYHTFTHVVDLLEEAAIDPQVRRIAITLYRVARASAVCEALAKAARNGKQVDVVMELRARFDEGNNLRWASLLSEAGARISYGVPGYKVHAKVLLLETGSASKPRRYTLLGTGNFNEQTAGIYSDIALLTAQRGIAREVAAVFARLMKGEAPDPGKLLPTSPVQLRAFLEQAIDREIEHALQGKRAEIFLKLNSLEDKPLIRKLYDAERAGVKVRLIVRGICCLKTGLPGYSKGIKAISIVDRFLEHSRIYVFHDLGRSRIYLASADWMERNLDRRVEIAFPVLEPAPRAEIFRYLELQWADNVKARLLDTRQTNVRRKRKRGTKPVRAQREWYRLLEKSSR